MTRRPRATYANVASTLCLVVLVGGGTAYAAGLGKNTVGSEQIKNGQVKNVDLGADSVKGRQVDDNSLTGADVLESSLTGLDAAEVGGLQVKKIRYQRSHGTSTEATVLDFPGRFHLLAECPDAGAPMVVTAVAEELGASIFTSSTNQFAADEDGSTDLLSNQATAFNDGDEFVVSLGNGTFGTTRSIDVRYAGPAGFVADVSLFYVGATALGQCLLTGVGYGG